MTLEEFREDLINGIRTDSLVDSIYKTDAFIEYCKDILINDYNLLSELDISYKEYKYAPERRQFKSMRVDASYLELSVNTLHLMYADFNEGDIQIVNNEWINQKATLLINFVYNVMAGFFDRSPDSELITQTAREFRRNVDNIAKLHLFIVTTNKRSDRLKTTISMDPIIIGTKSFGIDLTFLDIDTIYKTKSEGFKKEDVIIKTADFGLPKGIPCIKADIISEDYDSYLAVVPGKFLSDIYLQYPSQLLESNVRSFLNTRGEINKGILNTILNNKNRFFAYNNGIATTASEVTIVKRADGFFITDFTNLQIINGGQTTASLASAVLKHNANLDGIFVQMKLTLIKNDEERPELIRLIAKFANKQNKVTAADLSSNHPFYARMEEFSRKIKTPPLPNSIIQTAWFFERARGQYDQAKMKRRTKSERDSFERLNPKGQKITKTDLAKYINASEMRPYDVAWGAEVNMQRFQAIMEKDWDKSNLRYNESYFKELVAKAIFFKTIEQIVSDAEWYQAQKGYRAQTVAYTFSKFVYEAKKLGKLINYRRIWETQACLPQYKADLEKIAHLVFNTLNDPQRQMINIGEYAKRDICWVKLNETNFTLSTTCVAALLDKEERAIEARVERVDQRLTNEVASEIEIFKLGIEYWNRALEVGTQLGELNDYEKQLIDVAIKYIQQKYRSLSRKQVKDIWSIKLKMDQYLN